MHPKFIVFGGFPSFAVVVFVWSIYYYCSLHFTVGLTIMPVYYFEFDITVN